MSSSTLRAVLRHTGGLLSQSTTHSRGRANPAAQRRLLSALAVLEQRDGKLNVGSLSAVTAAKQLGGSIHGFVAGGDIKSVAEEAAKVEGVEKVITVDNAAYDKVCLYTEAPSPATIF